MGLRSLYPPFGAAAGGRYEIFVRIHGFRAHLYFVKSSAF